MSSILQLRLHVYGIYCSRVPRRLQSLLSVSYLIVFMDDLDRIGRFFCVLSVLFCFLQNPWRWNPWLAHLLFPRRGQCGLGNLDNTFRTFSTLPSFATFKGEKAAPFLFLNASIDFSIFSLSFVMSLYRLKALLTT